LARPEAVYSRTSPHGPAGREAAADSVREAAGAVVQPVKVGVGSSVGVKSGS
jgi:hypothetical protein